ncbi:MAG: hypothetical protein AB1331_07805 [Bacillota bacterium]
MKRRRRLRRLGLNSGNGQRNAVVAYRSLVDVTPAEPRTKGAMLSRTGLIKRMDLGGLVRDGREVVAKLKQTAREISLAAQELERNLEMIHRFSGLLDGVNRGKLVSLVSTLNRLLPDSTETVRDMPAGPVAGAAVRSEEDDGLGSWGLNAETIASLLSSPKVRKALGDIVGQLGSEDA